MHVQDIPLSLLFPDYAFNSRGVPRPKDTGELARSMRSEGLRTPIAVQPWGDGRYRIVYGYCRYKAAQILGWESIPAVVHEGLTEAQARLMNLGENVVRSDLDILQEARALAGLADAGVDPEDLPGMLGKSKFWVSVRFGLLKLPEDVQEEVAAGLIPQDQIRPLVNLGDAQAQRAEASRYKAAREGGCPVRVRNTSVKRFTKCRARRPEDMREMRLHLAKHLPEGHLALRVLDWGEGGASDLDVYRGLARVLDPAFDVDQIPVFVMPPL